MKVMQISLKINIADPVHVHALNVFIKAINEEPIEGIPADTKPEASTDKTEDAKSTKKNTARGSKTNKVKNEEAAKAEDTKSGLDISDLRKMVSEKAGDFRAEIKTKLQEYGASNVSSLDEEYFDDFMNFLKKL